MSQGKLFADFNILLTALKAISYALSIFKFIKNLGCSSLPLLGGSLFINVLSQCSHIQFIIIGAPRPGSFTFKNYKAWRVGAS